MSNPSKDQLKASISKYMGELKPAPEPEEVDEQPLLEEPADDENIEGKVEYEQIIGAPHPSGNRYWFTTYTKDDWDEDIQKFIPEVDNTHIFDHDYALALLQCVEYDQSVFVYGPPGCGKSVTPAQIMARINYPYMFIAGMGGTEPSDYIGSPWVNEGNMEWKDGPMAYAVRHGIFLLYDEPFKCNAQTNMCLQSLLDDRRTLKQYGHPDPTAEIKAHRKFRICLADNVRGNGDQMDRFAAEVQDQSTLNRTPIKMQITYLDKNREVELLRSKHPALNEKLASKIVEMAEKLRQGWDNNEIEMPFSIRDTQQWAWASIYHGDVAAGFRQVYFNSVREDSEKEAIRKLWQLVRFNGQTL